jgi:hypothetical protein
MELQTRIGTGASAVFVLVSYFATTLGLWISGLILFVCGGIAVWGLWPLTLPLRQVLAKYWNGSGRKHALALGMLLLGIGIGAVDKTGRHVFWTQSPDTGRIVWNFEETAKGIGYFLNLQKLSNEPEVRVVSFGAHGKNNSAEPLTDFTGYIRSDVTNATIPLYINAAEADAVNACTPVVPTSPKDTLGIPGFANFDVASSEKPFFINIANDGKPLSEFLRTFVPFTVVVQYDGKIYQRHFSR